MKLLKNYHVISVSYYNETIKIHSDRFKETIRIPYNYDYYNSLEVARAYLEGLGFEFIGKSEQANSYNLISTTFKSIFKSIRTEKPKKLEKQIQEKPVFYDIDENTARKAFFDDFTVYVTDSQFGVDSTNTFIIRKDVWDKRFNMPKYLGTPEEYGIEDILSWVREKAKNPLRFFTFYKKGILIIENNV